MKTFLRRHRIALAYAIACTALYAASIIDCRGVRDALLCGYSYALAAFFLLCPTSYAMLHLPEAWFAVLDSDHVLFAIALCLNTLFVGGIVEAAKRIRGR